MARPRKEIDKNQFEKLCAMQCTEEEICSWFDVTDKTLSGWCKREYHMSFSEVYAQKRVMGRISLRRSQLKLAEKNATMAIWLGKQYLGQYDRIGVEVSSSVSAEAVADVEAFINGIDSVTTEPPAED